MTVFCRA